MSLKKNVEKLLNVKSVYYSKDVDYVNYGGIAYVCHIRRDYQYHRDVIITIAIVGIIASLLKYLNNINIKSHLAKKQQTITCKHRQFDVDYGKLEGGKLDRFLVIKAKCLYSRVEKGVGGWEGEMKAEGRR